MFGWFRSAPHCPVDAHEKEWIERRMEWLTQEFGRERLQNVEVILPTPDYFPAPYSGTPEDAVVMLAQVCRYMGVPQETLRVHFFEDRNPVCSDGLSHGAAGLYQEADGKYEIGLEVGNLSDPLAMAATMAHELSHVILLGQRRHVADEEDMEPLTDLLTVFLGMGVFTANSVIRESNWHAGAVSGWRMGCQGYLSMSMFGYASATKPKRPFTKVGNILSCPNSRF